MTGPAAESGVASYPNLAGKVVVITGGSRGIGAATAVAFAVNRARVAVVGRDRSALDATVDAVTATGADAIGVVADCTVAYQLEALRHTVAERFGEADILATFAGGKGAPVSTAAETGQHWRDVLESDLTSTFLTISAFLPTMLARGGGTIVTMSSAAARHAARSSAAYAAAKAGVIALTRHLAGEYGPAGIRVNCVALSAIENHRMRSVMTPEQRQALGETFPLRRIGQPDDVASAALFLASSASGWITGATLDIAGGKVML